MKRLLTVVLLIAFMVPSAWAEMHISTFDDLTLASESYWNGDDDGSGYGTTSGFISGDNYFANYEAAAYYSWEGFAYSNTTDTITAGSTNQYSAYSNGGAGGGVGGSENFGVAFTMTMWGQSADTYNGYTSGDYAQTVEGFYATNTTYAYLSMLNGDSYATAFDEDDWFLLTINALNENYEETGDYVEFYLADGTDIVDDWTWVDTSELGEVYGLSFELTSSDVGTYGMNTPAYFAMDNLTTSTVPVPGAVFLMASGMIALAGVRRKTN